MDKMKIFIGWSGDLSRTIATHVRDWIPDVIRNAEPWLSSEDLRKGLQWLPELNKKLADSTIGIIVLTRENLSSSWVLFEAGTLSKALTESHCCTLLCDLKPTDVSGPLAQFQATRLDDKDMFRLVKTINAANGDAKIEETRLRKWFDQFWPEFEASCGQELQRITTPTDEGSDAGGPSNRELLEEILGTVRRLARHTRDHPLVGKRMASDLAAGTDADPANLFLEALPGESIRLRVPSTELERKAVEAFLRLGRASKKTGERKLQNAGDPEGLTGPKESSGGARPDDGKSSHDAEEKTDKR